VCIPTSALSGGKRQGDSLPLLGGRGVVRGRRRAETEIVYRRKNEEEENRKTEDQRGGCFGNRGLPIKRWRSLNQKKIVELRSKKEAVRSPGRDSRLSKGLNSR